MQSREGAHAMRTLAKLAALKTRCRRRGLWYRVLNRLERAQVDWTVRIIERVRSPLLARVLAAIMAKLVAALESPLAKLTRTLGVELARRLSHIARTWGNATAEGWTRDSTFARFLAAMNLNSAQFNLSQQRDS